jgi:hypothetical protein
LTKDKIAEPPTDLAKLFASGSDASLSEKIAELEKQLEAERDCRREDRFVSLVIILILLDIVLLDQAQSAAVVIVVFVLELLFLIVVAKRLGVEQIAGILDKLLGHFAKKSE